MHTKKKLPKHVAIIMDGNGRWGEEFSRGRLAGHRKGAANVRTIVEHARQVGIPYLTLYAFSTENWSRPHYEVNALIRLMQHFTEREADALREADVRVRFIGDHAPLPPTLLDAMATMEEKTKECLGMMLTIAINYGGRDEIVRAIRGMLDERIAPENLTEASVAQYLDTWPIPDVDLLIRTGGNQRLSNFMPWQTVYAELHFTETYWPAFTPAEMDLIISLYATAERRFGGINTAAE